MARLASAGGSAFAAAGRDSGFGSGLGVATGSVFGAAGVGASAFGAGAGATGTGATPAVPATPAAGLILPLATGADGAGRAGTGSGAALSRSGISIGMSTEIGRGCVSNSSGKPTTPASTSTVAPIRRWRARRRIASMLSGWRVADPPSPAVRNLKKAMKRLAGRDLARKMFGLKAGHAVPQDAAHRVERSEDDDSISGVRCGHRGAEAPPWGSRGC